MTEGHIDRLNAALEGRYRIVHQLGEGGMAVVYLADDLRHDRKVALKVLKPELAAVVGAERFLAEIKTTASLQHPHILPLFDSGEANGFLFYVMPYVEGDSLRDRLDRERQLPVESAVQIAASVAGALDYAHRQGVVHRDIKPANILIHDGQPVISDFGIALAVGAAGGGRLTETGLSLGTPHYMSPEQATGEVHVGPAADIYALGCVLYEMLVAEPPYTGGTPQAILGRIITGDSTPVTKTRPSVPANVDAAIRKALERVPADRFTTAAAFAAALTDPGFRHGDATAAAAAGGGAPMWRTVAIAATALAAVSMGVAVNALRRPEAPARVARFEWPFRAGQEAGDVILGALGQFTISPDGSVLVYATGAATPLWALRWGDVDPAPIRGTEGGARPAVSYDGQRVAYELLGNVIKVQSMAGGAARTITESGNYPRWAPNGDLYFIDADSGEILRAPADGGATVVVVPSPDGFVLQHVWDLLPGGERGLGLIQREPGGPVELTVIDLGDGAVTPLGIEGAAATYASTGHIVYVNQGDSTLMAAPFDVDRSEVGTPVPLFENVSFYALSGDGTLVYSTFPAVPTLTAQLTLVSPAGETTILDEVDGVMWFPRFSPDGSRIVYGLSETFSVNEPGDLWVVDVTRRARTRITFEANNRWYPVWTPDGTRVTHADAPGGETRILSTMADGSGVVDTIFDRSPAQYPTDWSPDGRTLAYYRVPTPGGPTSRDVWIARPGEAGSDPQPFITTPFSELGAIFSPDGRWVAYVSDKSGEFDVYARPFPGPGAEVTVSVGGGTEPAWGPNGDRLYYRREGELMVVLLQPTAGSLGVGTPRRVMDDEYWRPTGGGAGGMAGYDIAPDGSAFVMVDQRSSEATPARVFVVLNWLEELKERVPN